MRGGTERVKNKKGRKGEGRWGDGEREREREG